ncbi:hypothetical protein BDR05DRAFT_975908 [Suillus weaverae]|nr:hypothetical protein BDR05DRAFT_975908 [Suillus weaverae]
MYYFCKSSSLLGDGCWIRRKVWAMDQNIVALEIESYVNLLFSHLLTQWPTNSPEIKRRLLAPGTSNLFIATPRNSAPICTALLQVAAANGEQWLQEWEISSEERSQFLKSIIDAFIKSGQPETACHCTFSYISSSLSSSPEAKDYELFSPLQVFLNGGLLEFYSWLENHPAVLKKYELGRAQLERKIRRLSFASRSFAHVGHDLLYSEVASTLHIELSQVEKWVIDTTRAGLLSGKLSQTTQSLHVYRMSARTFEREQWEALENRLVAWKAGLASVLEVVSSAQKSDDRSACRRCRPCENTRSTAVEVAIVQDISWDASESNGL